MPVLSQAKLRLGWISYLNLLPLKCEIQKHLNNAFDFSYGPPSVINNLMRVKKVDLAPSSSICLLKDNPLYTLPLGVCANGPVDSVYMGFQKEHEAFLTEFFFCLGKYKARIQDLIDDQKNYQTKARDYLAYQYNSRLKQVPRLILTNQSETSLELGKILLTLVLGKRQLNQMCSKLRKPKGAQVELLIGDQALLEKKRFYKTLDLSEVWQKITGLPFVFAVWQSHKKISIQTQTELFNVAKIAEKNMHTAAEQYLEFVPEDQKMQGFNLKSYWKKLHYVIDDEKQQGLRLFLELAKLRTQDSSYI